VMNWVVQHLDERTRDLYTWQAAAQAAAGGHLHLVQLVLDLHDNLPGDVQSEPMEHSLEDLYTSAGKHGHVAVLEWLTGKLGVSFHQWSDRGSRLCCLAAASGHLAVLQWASRHGCAACWEENVCKAAVVNYRLETLQWLVDTEQHPRHRAALTSRVSLAATQGGHLEVLQLLRRHGCEWNATIPHTAAKHGNLEVLQWAVSEGCEWRPHEAKAVAVAAGWNDVVGWIKLHI